MLLYIYIYIYTYYIMIAAKTLPRARGAWRKGVEHAEHNNKLLEIIQCYKCLYIMV